METSLLLLILNMDQANHCSLASVFKEVLKIIPINIQLYLIFAILPFSLKAHKCYKHESFSFCRILTLNLVLKCPCRIKAFTLICSPLSLQVLFSIRSMPYNCVVALLTGVIVHSVAWICTLYCILIWISLKSLIETNQKQFIFELHVLCSIKSNHLLRM